MQIAENFGLLPNGNSTSAPPWGEFKKEIAKLNQEAEKDVMYKVLFMARHGQGYHNAAEKYYGKELWDVNFGLSDTRCTY